MTWQRARVIRLADGKNVPPIGYEMWVSGEPEYGTAVGFLDGDHYNEQFDPASRRYRTNLLVPNWTPSVQREVFAPVHHLELLARGPEDFCDDPPRVAWGSW
jgi:hypothetical protein